MKNSFIRQYWQSIFWILAIIYASLAPKNTIKDSFELFKHQDKVIHIIMYFGCAFLILKNRTHFLAIKKATYIYICISIISGSIIIEFLQPIVANRTCDIMDMISNATGTLIGLLAFAQFYKRTYKTSLQ